MSAELHVRPARVKPLLRGVTHLHSFSAALAAGAVLIAAAKDSTTALVTAVYVASLAGLFGTSALYHRPMWSQRARAVLKRIDHAAIFLLIAGTMTPVSALAVPAPLGGQLVAAGWIGAGLGMLRAVFWPGAPRLLVVAPYVLVGWLPVFALPSLYAGLGALSFGLVVGGGVLYTVGAVAYGLRRPDPWPRVFGYHEVFHALVVIAAVMHFVAVLRLVLR